MPTGRSPRVAVFLAVRSVLRSNHGVAVLTTLMLTLIFLDLLFLPSLIQGAVNRVNSQIVNTLTSNVAISASGARTAITGATSYLSEIRHTQGVQNATAVLRVGQQVSYGSYSGVWDVDAIDPTSYRAVFTTPANTIEGHYLTQTSGRDVFLGIGIAGADQTKVRGYKASLQHVHAAATVQITLRNGQVAPFTVAGIYDDQFPLSDKTAYITQQEAQALLPGSANRATTIFVRTTKGTDINEVVTRLQRLRGNVNFETSAALSSAVQDQIATFNLINKILKVVSLLVAAIMIFIITYVDLVNKRRQIGIERAIGIKPTAIVASYVLKAWTYAIVGIVAGLLLFKLAIIPLVHQHPFHFPNGPVVLATNAHEIRQDILILLIVALIAAAVPAIQSVRLRIIDAIWGT